MEVEHVPSILNQFCKDGARYRSVRKRSLTNSFSSSIAPSSYGTLPNIALISSISFFALSKLKPHFLIAFPKFFKEPRSLTPPFSEKATTAQATINPLHILGQARRKQGRRGQVHRQKGRARRPTQQQRVAVVGFRKNSLSDAQRALRIAQPRRTLFRPSLRATS